MTISSIARTRIRRVALAAIGAVVAGAALAPVAWATPAADHAGDTDCRSVVVPVKLADSTSGPIAGTLCTPPGATRVQVLVHGFSYDQYYFDSPYEPETYSLAGAANRRGDATLNISRLGVGDSLRPLSTQATLQNNGDALHQVIDALRDGSLGTGFDKVVLVGHSYGSLTSWYTAGTYGGVDAIVATGASHQPNFANVTTRIFANSQPATLDPKFAGEPLDPGYLTTRPGKRTVFYNLGNTDPKLIELDEKLKQTGTVEEFATYLPDLLFVASRQINMPILSVNGDDEPYFCNGALTADCSSPERLKAGEQKFYGPGTELDAIIVPNGGHDVTLARSAPQTIGQIQDWIADNG